LQEYLQARKHALPQYDVVNIVGEPHDQTFYVNCHIELCDEAVEGKGNSRRIAEQNAAAKALKKLEKKDV
ncbi:MAG: ribonuclease III, partial [Oceanospirillaceae bacterium]|nr:ribonuclease III [Oceanospirillaceae bacterium]